MPNVAAAWSQASKTGTCTFSDLFRLVYWFLLSIQVVHLGGKIFLPYLCCVAKSYWPQPSQKGVRLDSLSFALSVASFLRPACEETDTEFMDVYSACICSSGNHRQNFSCRRRCKVSLLPSRWRNHPQESLAARLVNPAGKSLWNVGTKMGVFWLLLLMIEKIWWTTYPTGLTLVFLINMCQLVTTSWNLACFPPFLACQPNDSPSLPCT